MQIASNDVIMDILDQITQVFRQMIREELAGSIQSETRIVELKKPVNQKDLCAFLGLSEPTIIRWRKKGKIPFIQIGSTIRYDIEAVLAALAGNKKTKRS